MREIYRKKFGGWSRKKFKNGKSFNEIFKLGRIPYWSLFEDIVLYRKLRKPFERFDNILGRTKKEKCKDFKKYLASLIYPKETLFREIFRMGIRKFKKIRKSEEGEKILLLATEGDVIFKENKEYYRRFDLVIRKLRKDRKVKDFILVNIPFYNNTFHKLLKYEHTIYEYIDFKIIKNSIKKAKESYKKWKNLSDKEKNELMKINNGSLWPYFKYQLNYLFSKEIIFLYALYMEAFNKILKDENIKLVFLTSYIGPVETLMVNAAKNQDIEILVMQHGMGLGILNKEKLKRVKYVVFGEAFKKQLTKIGMDPRNVIITGPITFDESFKYINCKRRKNKKKKILFITANLVEWGLVEKNEYFHYIEKCLQELKKLKDIQIIIKLHPAERHIKEYKRIVDKLNLRNVTITQQKGESFLYKLIFNCDVLLNIGSTVGVEGIILNRPVIKLADLGKYREDSILEYGKVLKARIDEDISTLVKKALYDKEVRGKLKEVRGELIKDYLYKIDGKAHERVVNLMYEIVNKKS